MKQSVKPSSPRKKYDRIFKQDAVQLWRTSGKSATFMAEELGLKPSQLYAWSQDFAPPTSGGEGGVGAKSRAQLLEENTALRQELEAMRQQRDILKKTLGILSEPPTNATNGSKR